jgi:hypothetical protein
MLLVLYSSTAQLMKIMIQYLVLVDGKTRMLQKAVIGGLVTDELGRPERRLQATLWIEGTKPSMQSSFFIKSRNS